MNILLPPLRSPPQTLVPPSQSGPHRSTAALPVRARSFPALISGEPGVKTAGRRAVMGENMDFSRLLAPWKCDAKGCNRRGDNGTFLIMCHCAL